MLGVGATPLESEHGKAGGDLVVTSHGVGVGHLLDRGHVGEFCSDGGGVAG